MSRKNKESRDISASLSYSPFSSKAVNSYSQKENEILRKKRLID
jgi:hypothetical protein